MLGDALAMTTRAVDIGHAGVVHEWDAVLLEAPAECLAVSIFQCVVEDCCGPRFALDQNQRLHKLAGRGHCGAGFFEGSSDVEREDGSRIIRLRHTQNDRAGI